MVAWVTVARSYSEHAPLVPAPPTSLENRLCHNIHHVENTHHFLLFFFPRMYRREVLFFPTSISTLFKVDIFVVQKPRKLRNKKLLASVVLAAHRMCSNSVWYCQAVQSHDEDPVIRHTKRWNSLALEILGRHKTFLSP